MSTDGTKRMYEKKQYKLKSLQDVKDLVNYLEPKRVKRIKIGDLEIEFDTLTPALERNMGAAAELEPDREVQMDEVRNKAESLLKDQDKDLFWST